MLRLSAVAALVLLLGSGTALAGDCDTTASAFGNEGSIFFSNAPSMAPGTKLTCSVANPLSVPAGYYGVFKTYAGGYATLSNGKSVRFSLKSNGANKGTTVTGPYDDQTVVEAYYATGKVAVDTAFSGKVTVDMTKAGGADYGELNAVDLKLGYTSLASIKASLDEVGREQAGLITHLDLDAGLLTGSDQPLEGDNEIGLLGGLGSYDFGITGRYNLAQGFSLLGGVSAVSLTMPGASTAGALGAFGARYVQPGGGEIRWFGEGGLQAGALSMTFSRHYSNGTVASYEATGTGQGMLGAAYVRGGAVWQPNPDSQVVFSASLKQSVLGFTDFSEDDPAADPNLFAADYSGKYAGLTTLKAGADWTTLLQRDLDLTASLADQGTTMNGGASADVFGIGAVTGSPQSTLFAEYGLRLGWMPTPTGRVDGFVQGSTGSGIGTHVQVGAGYHLKF